MMAQQFKFKDQDKVQRMLERLATRMHKIVGEEVGIVMICMPIPCPLNRQSAVLIAGNCERDFLVDVLDHATDRAAIRLAELKEMN